VPSSPPDSDRVGDQILPKIPARESPDAPVPQCNSHPQYLTGQLCHTLCHTFIMATQAADPICHTLHHCSVSNEVAPLHTIAQWMVMTHSTGNLQTAIQGATLCHHMPDAPISNCCTFLVHADTSCSLHHAAYTRPHNQPHHCARI
jgi:hypothetical protein